MRVIAATHIDLAAAVAKGEFREDLYYRLNVVALVLPPLRERGEDVELLAEAFVDSLAKQYDLPTPQISEVARAVLRALTWPGNVRELRNTIERALVLSPPGTLLIADPPRGRAAEAPVVSPLPFPATLRTITQSAATAMLELVGGNKSEAARRLGISRPRLLRLLDGTERRRVTGKDKGRPMKLLSFRTLFGTALAVAAAACAESTGNGGGTALNFLQLDANAPALCNDSAGAWFIKDSSGAEQEIALTFPETGSTCAGSTHDFLRLRIKGSSLQRHPDSTLIDNGDSVFISVKWVGSDSILFDLQPTGLLFDHLDPAELKIEYNECGARPES